MPKQVQYDTTTPYTQVHSAMECAGCLGGGSSAWCCPSHVMSRFCSQVTDPSVNMTGNVFNFSGLGKHSNNKCAAFGESCVRSFKAAIAAAGTNIFCPSTFLTTLRLGPANLKCINSAFLWKALRERMCGTSCTAHNVIVLARHIKTHATCPCLPKCLWERLSSPIGMQRRTHPQTSHGWCLCATGLLLSRLCPVVIRLEN